jgi:hypothetical protein
VNDTTIAFDDNEQRMLMNYRIGFMRMVSYFLRKGNAAEAKRVLQQMEQTLPLDVVSNQQWTYTNYVAKLFYEFDDREHFQKYAAVVERKCLELINAGPVLSTDPSSNPYVVVAGLYGMQKEYGKAVAILRNLEVQYPHTPWIEGEIMRYQQLLLGAGATGPVQH